MRISKHISFALLALILWSCSEQKSLPILGESQTDPISGALMAYRAPEFELTNQLNQTTSSALLEGKIQVVDFFFTSCPTICPKMTTHLKLVQEAFIDQQEVAIISYSIDAAHDDPARLKRYADSYEIDHSKWKLLTGDQNTILELAKDYKVRAFDDSSDLGPNLIHDGTFVLVDQQRRIRGYYNGLDLLDTQALISDINLLLNE